MNTPTNTLFFQYCQKMIVFSEDHTKVLLAKRKGEQDYDGVFSFIGGKLETTDGSFLAGLSREKTEEIGNKASMRICPTLTYNLLFKKRDGNHMVLPHYIAVFTSGSIDINDEYSEYAWVPIKDLQDFEPKIENIPKLTAWAQRTMATLTADDWVAL